MYKLSIKCLLDLFDKMIKSILLYGCEVWGFSNNDILEKKIFKIVYDSFKFKTHERLAIWCMVNQGDILYIYILILKSEPYVTEMCGEKNNNKACGDDLVINEYIKSTTEKFIELYENCLTLYFNPALSQIAG